MRQGQHVVSSRRERVDHWWRRNHGTYVPRNLFFLQTHAQKIPVAGDEDTTLERLDFGVCRSMRYGDDQADRDELFYFETPLEFWAWFHGRHRKRIAMWLIGHGIASSFTLVNGWHELDRGFYSLNPKIRDGRSYDQSERDALNHEGGWLVDGDPPTILLLYHQQVVVHVVDIQNYGRASIDEIAAEVGRPMPPDPPPHASLSVWRAHIEHQVNVVRDYFCELLAFWRAHDCGQWRHTFAGLAMSAYRHRHLNCKVLVHTCKEALELERAALSGGEFRSFFVGPVHDVFSGARAPQAKKRKREPSYRDGPVYVYDVNALYPSVMRGRLYPVELGPGKMHGSIEDIQAWRDHFCLLANVELETVETPYPYMDDGERYWAVGNFWTALAGPELLQAVDAGHVRRVGMLATYWPADLFTSFVDEFYALRLKAPARLRKLWNGFCKNLLNALPGKCGQRAPNWEFCDYTGPHQAYGSWPGVDAQTGEIHQYRAISGSVQVSEGKREGYDSVPAIEAYVNSYARLEMAKIRRAVGERNILYQASDALHVLAEALPKIQPFLERYPGELGKLREVGVYETAEYRGPNDYTVGDVWVISGRKAEASKVKDGKYEQSERQSLRSVLGHEPGGFLRVKRIRKTVGGYHPRGILNPDGSVSPPQVREGKIHFRRNFPGAYPWQPAGTSK